MAPVRRAKSPVNAIFDRWQDSREFTSLFSYIDRYPQGDEVAKTMEAHKSRYVNLLKITTENALEMSFTNMAARSRLSLQRMKATTHCAKVANLLKAARQRVKADDSELLNNSTRNSDERNAVLDSIFEEAEAYIEHFELVKALCTLAIGDIDEAKWTIKGYLDQGVIERGDRA